MSTKELKRQKNVSKGLVKNREYLKEDYSETPGHFQICLCSLQA
jgi:hypothetical protein